MAKILITGNCQTVGVTNALNILLPDHAIQSEFLPWPFDRAEHFARMALLTEGVDVWITIGSQSGIDATLALNRQAPRQIIKMPAIGFAAFHPDLCYAKNRADETLTQHHYNSAIVAWAYRHDIDISDTVRLFRREVFRRLGYFDMWHSSRECLHNQFKASSLSDYFQPFWLNIKRSGNFMHSINHPKIHVIAKLSQLLTSMVTNRPLDLIRELGLHDNLDQVIWPLYPDIAQEYSLPGGDYLWKISESHYIDGLAPYIEFCWNQYRMQKIERQNLCLVNRDQAQFDQVLMSSITH